MRGDLLDSHTSAQVPLILCMATINLQHCLKPLRHALNKSLADSSGDVKTPDPLDLFLHHRHNYASLLFQLVLEHMPKVLDGVQIRGAGQPICSHQYPGLQERLWSC